MISRQSLRSHRTDGFGSLWLTDAVCPAPDLPVSLAEGYRRQTYRGRPHLRIPALAAAVSREHLLDVFLGLLRPLGAVVDLVLETSHASSTDRHRDLRRTHIDRPVLESYLCEFEGLLLNDGCTGVAVIATTKPMEVQFDEHKHLVAYAHDLKPFRRVLHRANIPYDPHLQLISDGPHLHHSLPEYSRQFRDLALRLGAGMSTVLSAEY